MPTLVARPIDIEPAGNKPKLTDEYIGRVNTQTTSVSLAHMPSPQGWEEPGPTPQFDEFTLVLKGLLRVRHKRGDGCGRRASGRRLREAMGVVFATRGRS
jgi:ethanolamine utilization protein EutQ